MRVVAVLIAALWTAPVGAQTPDAPRLRLMIRGPVSEYQALVAGLQRHPVQFVADGEYTLEGLFATRRGQLQFELLLKHGRRVLWTRSGPVPSPGAELLGAEAGEALVRDWRAERRIDLVVEDVSYPQLRLITRALGALPQVRQQTMWRYEARTAEYDLLLRDTPHAGALAQRLEALDLDGHRLQATVVDETHLKIRIIPPPTPDAGTETTP